MKYAVNLLHLTLIKDKKLQQFLVKSWMYGNNNNTQQYVNHDVPKPSTCTYLFRLYVFTKTYGDHIPIIVELMYEGK